METIQITKDAAVKAHENAGSEGKTLLENLLGKQLFIKNIRECIQGWDDVLAIHNTTQEQFDKWCEGLAPHETATRQAEMIAEAYNQGQKADWKDGKPKGTLIFNMGDASGSGFSLLGVDNWTSFSYVGARLVFCGPDWQENGKDAAKKFLNIYQIALTY